MSGISTALLGAAGISATGNIVSGILGSNAASGASQQAVTGGNAAISAAYGGQNSAISALEPYNQGGLENYDYLNYLLTGAQPGAQSGGSTNSNAWQSIYSQYDTTAPRATTLQGAIDQITGYLGNFYNTRGGQSGKYGAAYANAQSVLSQLQQQQQQQTASEQGQQIIGSGGLPAGWLTNIPQFSYDPNTDSNLKNASIFANGVLSSQNAAAGNYGSGNMASSIATELAGTLEPTYYNQAYQNYVANQITPRNTVYNELTGNVGGSGQTTAQNMSNVYTGNAANAGQYLSSTGQSAASGTAAQGTALSNTATGLGNTATSAAGQYMNYLNSQNIAQAIQNGSQTNSQYGGIDYMMGMGTGYGGY